MDRTHPTQSPTAPAFPQGSPNPTSNHSPTSAELPKSPVRSNNRRNSTQNENTSNSAFSANPPAAPFRTLPTIPVETITTHRQGTLHTRRASRRRRRTCQTPFCRQAHFYHQFVHVLRPLQPLVSIETGLAHPCFPRTILQYHLLSHEQLDALAEHYHQSAPSSYSLEYPTTVVGRWWAERSVEEEVLMKRDQHFEALIEEARGVLMEAAICYRDPAMVGIEDRNEGLEVGVEEVKGIRALEVMIEDKRRKFGRFIGLRECESPGVDDERVMERAMEAWVWGQMDRRMRSKAERKARMTKGGW